MAVPATLMMIVSMSFADEENLILPVFGKKSAESEMTETPLSLGRLGVIKKPFM